MAVEFALIAVPFFFLLGSILEEGLIMLTEYSLQRGTEGAARLIRIGRPPRTLADFREEVCAAALAVPNCRTTTKPKIFVRYAADFESLDMAPSAQVYDTGLANSAVIVSVTYEWEYIFAVRKLLNPASRDKSYEITAVTTFRNEPF